MVQILYTLTAIFVLGITVLTLNVKIHSTQQRMILSELSLEMTSVGAEVLNEIGTHPFDAHTGSGGVVPRSALSAEGTWGTSGCDLDDRFRRCFGISDFQGTTATRTLTRTHENEAYEVTYVVTVDSVAYVAEAAPHASTNGVRSYAKGVWLSVSTPSLRDADGALLQVPMARVYTYPQF